MQTPRRTAGTHVRGPRSNALLHRPGGAEPPRRWRTGHQRVLRCRRTTDTDTPSTPWQGWHQQLHPRPRDGVGPRGITVKVVAPGWVRTDMNAALRENGHGCDDRGGHALGRFGEASDVAAVVAFLASDEGRWVTAQVIEASGGYKL
ncbi:SDR family oxidoreductase [Streptomyces sp. NPDC059446]|uniref:SDR family oxidoreductase n=1 Tax=Streptomyces sp. NPDC059446 TaxID=3346833 RepID=UPI0036A975FD